ncbi:unnamed protein product [Caenorhabditis angaria]|uniref:Uncharacterized protein n=1 Tax=Caenorhabditis angaria TaxID=860376 RepID=A0A9P1MV35_9PELO|nr:unnamed protein product [Caenorhabditis angaria]
MDVSEQILVSTCQMQIKNGEDQNTVSVSESEGASADGVPIYSSLESLLIIPPSMSQELSEAARLAQRSLDNWSNNRRHVIRKLDSIARELDEWEKNCSISTAVGSSVGIVSGGAVIGGLIFMPPVAIAGLIVGTVAGASNVVTGLAKWQHMKMKAKDVNAYCDHDKVLFEELMRDRDELMEVIRRIIQSEDYQRHFEHNFDNANNIKNILGATVFGAGGLATRYAILEMGRLSSSLVKGVLHSVAVIGIILDSVTLALSAKDLSEEKRSKFGDEILELAGKLELDRQKVCKDFLNQDVWNVDDSKTEEDMERLSDSGSIEFVQRIPSAPVSE